MIYRNCSSICSLEVGWIVVALRRMLRNLCWKLGRPDGANDVGGGVTSRGKSNGTASPSKTSANGESSYTTVSMSWYAYVHGKMRKTLGITSSCIPRPVPIWTTGTRMHHFLAFGGACQLACSAGSARYRPAHACFRQARTSRTKLKMRWDFP